MQSSALLSCPISNLFVQYTASFVGIHSVSSFKSCLCNCLSTPLRCCFCAMFFLFFFSAVADFMIDSFHSIWGSDISEIKTYHHSNFSKYKLWYWKDHSKKYLLYHNTSWNNIQSRWRYFSNASLCYLQCRMRHLYLYKT